MMELAEDAVGACWAMPATRLRASAATDVLIIEDEPIIAMDIEELVHRLRPPRGRRGVDRGGCGATWRRRTKPGLILADINLGLGGDGTNRRSARILKYHYAPVIFVTAYPERLLTGEAVEPAFVITKPVRAADAGDRHLPGGQRAALDLVAGSSSGNPAGNGRRSRRRDVRLGERCSWPVAWLGRSCGRAGSGGHGHSRLAGRWLRRPVAGGTGAERCVRQAWRNRDASRRQCCSDRRLPASGAHCGNKRLRCLQ